MNIWKAYCVELGRSINIIDARNAYFEQPAPRKRFDFTCSSPQCQALGRVVITAVNYDKVTQDNDKFQAAHFRGTKKELHSPDCKWVIEDDAKASIEAKSTNKRSPNKKVADGYIQRATFLTQREVKESTTSESENEKSPKESTVRQKKPSTAERIKGATSKLNKGRSSSSFSELVSDYLEINRNKAWNTPLGIDGLPIETYGQFFKKIQWYDDDYRQNHAYYGSVEIMKVYPNNFEFESGELPSGISLKFEQEVTVEDIDRNPTLYIKKEDFETAPGAHVLAEAVNLALNNDEYHDQLWCHFYGKIIVEDIEFTDKKSGDTKIFKTLSVVPENMGLLELVVRAKTKK